MALSKKIENIVIGIDPKQFVVKILNNKGGDFRKANIEYFECDQELIEGKKIFEILNNVLPVYLAGKNFQQADVYIVLPDYFVTLDRVTLPIMQQNKMKDAIKSELKRLYFNYNDMEINNSLLYKNKKQAVFNSTIVPKSIISDCVMVCKKLNLNLRNISYNSNAVVNSFLALGNKIKHGNYILANINEDSSSLIYVSKDKMQTFLPLEFGYSILRQEHPAYLTRIIDNEHAKKEVFFAKAVSKSKKHELYSENLSYDEINKETQQRIIAEDRYILNQRELTTAEKNFQIFMRHILGFKDELEVKTNSEIDFAIVNFPEEFKDLVSKTDNFELRYLGDELMEECYLTEFLDLYGMLYSVIYNKAQNFADKEQQSFAGKVSMNFSRAVHLLENSIKKK